MFSASFRSLIVLVFVAAVARAEQQPNIVFILADDLGWADTTLYGHTKFYQTQNLDRLAKRGMTFSRAYSASPLCSPTRASILTGLSPARTGITAPRCHAPKVVLKAQNGQQAPVTSRSIETVSVTRLHTRYETLAETLKAAGYATGHFGKWHLGPEPYSPLEHGFDVDVPHWPGPGPAGSFVAPWKYPDFKAAAPGEHIEDRMAREASAWMEKHADRPFFLNYWMFSVHAPFDAKKALIAKHRGRVDPANPQRSPTYAAMVESMDDAVGALLDTLDRLKIADRTIIVFYSDNGGNMYDSVDGTTPTSNAPLRGGKSTMWEGGIRVPAVVAWPGMTAPGSRSDAVIQSTDFFQTFLDGLGLKARDGQVFDGTSIVPALRGEPLSREPIFTFFPHSNPVPDWLPPAVAMHDGDWKLIRIFHGGEDGAHRWLLFNLREDLGEKHDLAAKEPDRVREMDAAITRYLAKTRAVVPHANPALSQRETAIERRRGEAAHRQEQTRGGVRSDRSLNSRPASEDAFSHEPQGIRMPTMNQRPMLLRTLLRAVAPLHGISLLILAAEPIRAADAPRPNVLFIATDDMRPQLGCYGDPVAKTPHLDRLAARGTVFERAYCQQALCSPSRISLLSGRYPATTRIFDIGTPMRAKMPDITTLPQHFKDNGYFARSLGKIYHVGIDDPASWSVAPWHSKAPRFGLEGRKMVRAAAEALKASGKPEPEKGPNKPFYAGPPFEAPEVDDDALLDGDTAREAVGALRELGKKGGPFFLAVGFSNPHVPWVAPKKYWDLYDPAKLPLAEFQQPPKDAPKFAAQTGADFRWYAGVPPTTPEMSEAYQRRCLHGYLAAISYVDAQVGRLLDALDELGLANNTVVVFWSDHGYYMGEHGWWGGKHNNYEGATRTPLLIAAPGQAKPGAKTRALAELVDVAPTLAATCGLPPAAGWEGKSLRPLLDDFSASVKDAAFSWYPKGGHMGVAMRTDRWRFVEWRKAGAEPVRELYDYESDPLETRNLAADPAHAERVAELASLLEKSGHAPKPVTRSAH